MTTVQFILIIIAVVIMMIGLYMIIRGITKKNSNKETQGISRDKNGIPIIPRHEREIFDDEEEIEAEREEDLVAGETVIKPDRDHLEAVIEDEEIYGFEDDELSQNGYSKKDNQNHVDSDGQSHSHSLNDRQNTSQSHYYEETQTNYEHDIDASLNTSESAASRLTENTEFDDLNPDYDTKDKGSLQASANQSTASQHDFNHGLDPQGKQIPQSQKVSPDDVHIKALRDAEAEDDLFSNLVSATETLMPVIETAEEPEFVDNSPMLDQHLLAEADQDQNSPLNHAEENINITLVPRNEYEKIEGKKILSLVSQYGLKYGAMNMFHRYEHKDGSGILWFSMMGVTEEGIAPFDLNMLPTSRYHGLVLFLSLPHPKATQGFDSMMSVVNLISNDLNMLVLDENNEILTRDRRQQLRNQVQEYQSSRY